MVKKCQSGPSDRRRDSIKIQKATSTYFRFRSVREAGKGGEMEAEEEEARGALGVMGVEEVTGAVVTWAGEAVMEWKLMRMAG